MTALLGLALAKDNNPGPTCGAPFCNRRAVVPARMVIGRERAEFEVKRQGQREKVPGEEK